MNFVSIGMRCVSAYVEPLGTSTSLMVVQGVTVKQGSADDTCVLTASRAPGCVQLELETVSR